MAHHTHEDVAQRWANRAIFPGREALNSRNLHDMGDRINSYGSHFEVGRVLRDRKGDPTGWLLNGDRWPGVVTTRHQNAVRAAVGSHNLPIVTIPHTALSAASIELRSIEIIDVQDDWWTETIVTKEHLVGNWAYETDHSDRGGWINSRTGEFRERPVGHWGDTAPEVCTCEGRSEPQYRAGVEWDAYYQQKLEHEVHMRARHGIWEPVSGHRRNTGRKSAHMSTNVVWDLVDDPTAPLGYVFERVIQRHWLGASLIKGTVPYRINTKHQQCGGTGVVDMTDCRGCSGRGTVPVQRRRTAYFLSGFDTNETRPSYFFCELPPKVKPTTVEEALEALKPQAVKLAEQAGREVKRQGDIFAIPMPGLTLRDLKAQGGRHEKHRRVGGISEGGELLGTNHAATEVVYVGKQTYARGVIRHVPEFRRPDHKALTIGREWHLIQKNTVPVSN